jgi:hypothetical protein
VEKCKNRHINTVDRLRFIGALREFLNLMIEKFHLMYKKLFMKGTGILVCPVAGRMANGQKEIREFWNFIMSKSMSRAEKTRQTT